MRLLNFSSLPLFLLTSLSSLSSAFPDTPFSTAAQYIHDSTGSNFTYVGVNWPGHGEAMIPEGLQYQSIPNIVSRIKELGMNVVRLTFAIEMIDNILDAGGDVALRESFRRALGQSEGDRVFGQVVAQNPEFGEATTRLQVFDRVAEELAQQEIYVHLDNHISTAKWCCSGSDGNAWFGDTQFDVEKWKRGLEYMAEHISQWPSAVSIGMRNELRQPSGSALPYNWATWYRQTTDASDRINAANPDLLIFFSGLDYDTNLRPIPNAESLGDGLAFRLSDFAYADKLVLELHNYQRSASSCSSSIEGPLWDAGFKATGQLPVNQMPVVLTEFGFPQEDGSYQGAYASCLRTLMPQWRSGWTVWVLAGSYYTRSGTLDYEESWGLLDHEWAGWRSQEAINALMGMVQDTLAAVG